MNGVSLYHIDGSIALDGNRQLPVDWRRNDPDHWQSGIFTVPEKIGRRPVTEADVEDKYPYFRNKFGQALEREGWRVLNIQGPILDRGVVAMATTDADRRRYMMWARVERNPIPLTLDVPDEMVPDMLKAGLKLAK